MRKRPYQKVYNDILYGQNVVAHALSHFCVQDHSDIFERELVSHEGTKTRRMGKQEATTLLNKIFVLRVSPRRKDMDLCPPVKKPIFESVEKMLANAVCFHDRVGYGLAVFTHPTQLASKSRS